MYHSVSNIFHEFIDIEDSLTDWNRVWSRIRLVHDRFSVGRRVQTRIPTPFRGDCFFLFCPYITFICLSDPPTLCKDIFPLQNSIADVAFGRCGAARLRSVSGYIDLITFHPHYGVEKVFRPDARTA